MQATLLLISCAIVFLQVDVSWINCAWSQGEAAAVWGWFSSVTHTETKVSVCVTFTLSYLKTIYILLPNCMHYIIAVRNLQTLDFHLFYYVIKYHHNLHACELAIRACT